MDYDNPLTSKQKIGILLPILLTNRNLLFPPPFNEEDFYRRLFSKSRIKPTTMRSLVRFIVRMEAKHVQITDEHVISAVANILLRSATHAEKSAYKILSDRVNEKIKNRRQSVISS